MRRLLTLLSLFIVVFFTYTVIAQEFGSLRKGYEIAIPHKIQKLVLDPLPAGTYSVGLGGYFPTIDSAFNKLSIDGIAGEVTLELIDDLYTAPARQFGFSLIGPIPGAGVNSRVTIKPADNKNVIIEGNGNVGLYFPNVSYLTIDGVNLTGASTLTIHMHSNVQYGWNDCVSFEDNADHNRVQNIIFINEDHTRLSACVSFVKTVSSFAADSNIIQNNFVKESGFGFYFGPLAYSGVRFVGNAIFGNSFGSETDTLNGKAIQIEYAENTLIENNMINSVRFTTHVFVGINAYFSNGTTIRNNIVHNVAGNSSDTRATGILLSGQSGQGGNDNLIYNNMVYNIQCTSTQTGSRVSGIEVYSQNNPEIYYNSVYLYGNGNGANPLGSAALFITSSCTNVVAKNNILVNTRDESPYYASAIYDYYAPNLTSDYNDLYYDDTNPDNCLVRIGSTKYNTLAEWQATGQDSNSYNEMPHFIDPHLHIDKYILTNIDSGAIPITNIDLDIDGELRNVTSPDIGADEFDVIISRVEEESTLPTEFVLEQNYPNPFNPSTTIGFGLQNKSNVKITILNAIGEEVAVILNEEKESGFYKVEFTATNLPSGVYFYQLKAGSYVDTKKMLLLK